MGVIRVCAAAAASGVCLVGFRRLVTSPGPPFEVLVTKRAPCDPAGLFSWQEAIYASTHATEPARACQAPNPPLTPVKGPV